MTHEDCTHTKHSQNALSYRLLTPLLSPTDNEYNVCKAKVVMVNVQVTEAAAVQVLQ